MIHWFTKNHVAANLLMLAILLSGGYVGYFLLPVEVEPSVTFPRVFINVPYPGGAPKDVEQKIILPIEKELLDLDDADGIEASARRDSASVVIIAKPNADLDKLKAEVESRIDRITTFPDEVEKPEIFVPNTSNWKDVISVAIYGDLTENELILAARKVRDDLTAKPGISKVYIADTRKREIVIEVKPELLNAFGFTISSLADAIRQSSVDLSAGSINSHGERILIRSSNQAFAGEQFRKLVVSRSNGAEIRLGDIATIKDTFEDNKKIVRYNGQNAILVEILRREGENALRTAQIVHDYVKSSPDHFPAGVHLAAWDDDSVSLRDRLQILISNLIQGAILVLIMLSLFLRPSIAFWVVMGIPVSFAGAIACMHLFGVTANNMSIFGFIIVVGIVVDDAIVTGENIYARLKEHTLSPLDAVVQATKEVSTPVTFGVLTTIVAFIPLMYIDGYIGEMAKQIPLVVIPVLIFSLIESKLIFPSHLKNIKVNRENTNFITRTQRWIADQLETFTHKIYQPALNLCLRYRYITISFFIATLIFTLGFKNTVPFNPSPSMDRYFIAANLEMVQGSTIEDTDRGVQQIIAGAKAIRKQFVDPGTGESLIKNIVTSTGGHPWSEEVVPTQASVKLEILSPTLRSTPGPKNNEIAKAWREAVGTINGAEAFNIRAEQQNMRDFGGAAIHVLVRGQDDASRIRFTDEVESWLKKQEGLDSIWSDTHRKQRELQVKLNSQGEEAKLSQGDLARQLRTAFFGMEVQRIQRGEDELKVMLRLPEDQRESLHTLETLPVSIPDNKITSISQFAEVTEGESPPSIERRNAMRVSTIYASPKPEFNAVSIEPELTKKLNELSISYPNITWAYQGELAEYKDGNKKLYALFAILAFVLYALLAIPFKSFSQPLIVMSVIPFGIIGAFWGHVLLDIHLSYLSYFGVLALTGVVVNDSIVIVDFINQKRLAGESVSQAIADAGVRRFRPIILTSITTFAGLMPIIFEPSIEAQFVIPMAISLGFGILFATIITIFLVPCVYAAGMDISRFFSQLFHRTPPQVDQK